MKPSHLPTRFICLALLAALLLTSACSVLQNTVQPTPISGSGSVTQEVRAISTFDKFELSGQGSVLLTAGAEPALTIEAEDNLLAYMTADVSGGRLMIGVKDGVMLQPTEPITYRVIYPALSEIKLSGAGTISTDALSVERLTTILSGTGIITPSGSVDRMVIDLSGSGTINSQELTSAHASVSLGGAGNVFVNASDTLDVTLSGTGTVVYMGSPEITQTVSGVGQVVHSD
jgi:hypothetical protein